MSKKDTLPPALRHGAYSTLDVLPGEDRGKFDKLHRDLITELGPIGPAEDDLVLSIARLTWRKQNLLTLRIGRLAQHHASIIYEQVAEREDSFGKTTHEDNDKLRSAADARVRKDLGDFFGFVDVGHAASFENLTNELALEERFGGLIDRCYKRLLLLRGFKSLAATNAPPAPLRIVEATENP